MLPKGFADLASLPEDERIAIIGKTALTKTVGFFVDDEQAATRYIEKLHALYPGKLRIYERLPWPSKKTVIVKIGPK